jgi:hypothetical protein
LPQELLNSSERHLSADIFSLGLSLYELCLVPDLDSLPLSGQVWHDLRENRAPPITGRGEVLVLAIISGRLGTTRRRLLLLCTLLYAILYYAVLYYAFYKLTLISFLQSNNQSTDSM